MSGRAKAVRDDYITVRMSKGMKRVLSRRATALGMSISTYALYLIAQEVEQELFTTAGPVRSSDPDTDKNPTA